MICPDWPDLVRIVDGEGFGSAPREHLQACARCRAEVERLETLSRALGRVIHVPEDPAFTAELGTRLRHRRRSPWPWPWLAAPLAAAALLLVSRTGWHSESAFAPRGGQHRLAQTVGVDFFAQAPNGVARRLSPGARVSSAEGFSFIVRTHAGRPLWLALFGVDVRGEVHWFYPAWLKPDDNPQSILISPGPAEQPLAEAVGPLGAPGGPLKLLALFSERPLRVRTVESQLQAGGPNGLETVAGFVHLSSLEVLWE